MIKATVKDLITKMLIEDKLNDLDTLYMIRDGDTVFYVGQSQNPISRLWDHLGHGRALPSRTGRFIHINAPESLAFQIEILSPGEVSNEILEAAKYWSNLAGIKLHFDHGLITQAEQILIAKYAPCFNVVYNRDPTPLPEKYKNPSYHAPDLELTVSDFVPFV